MVVLIDRFKMRPPQPEPTEQEAVAKQYAHWRWRVFYSMYIGYALFYLTRNSFTFAMPSMMSDLGFDKGQLGLLASILSLVYGLSKFAAGILGDRSNPKYFMALGLIATGLCNIFFGLSSSLIFLGVFWGLNGWFQGFGWPACAKLLTHWYSQSERGRWWSWWNTSHNIGGALIPLFVAFCAANYGWRIAMIAPGILVILGGLFLMNRLTDTPKALGLPPVEKFRNDNRSLPAKPQDEELSAKQVLFSYVLNNPYIWILGITYFFVYIVRMAMNTWTQLYLVETKGYSQMAAGGVVFWFEIGGMFGSLVAGWASDKIFSANRGPVNALFCLFTTLAIYAFWTTAGSQPLLDSLLVFTIGFFIFGPQMLIGVAAAELSHKRAAASATGFIGFIAYIGSACAGYPLGIILKNFGWEGFFFALTGCAVLSFLLLFPLWAVKTAPENCLSKQRVR
jgi:MFS transporter, OPA family, sugar phosphate sensor protein UhpC